MPQPKQDREIQLLIDEATQIAEKLKIKKILAVCESLVLWQSLQPFYARCQFIIAVATKRLAERISVESFLCDFSGVARSDRLDYILRAAFETGKLIKGERVICLYSAGAVKLLDSLRILKVGEDVSPISPRDLKNFGRDIRAEVLFLLVSLATEIGREGREGKPVGAIFVVGDAARVLELSKPLIFNPFLGYPPEERNILDPKVQESIKELTLIDGAFVIRNDGIVESAGRFLHAGPSKAIPLKGLGARHAAAAAITVHTAAIAITVSESTGAVRIFSGGKVVKSIRSYRPYIRTTKR